MSRRDAIPTADGGGASYFQQDDLERAEHYFRRAYDLALELGTETEIATALGHLANLTSKRGDEDEAVRMYLQALEIQRREMGVHPFIARSLWQLGQQAKARELAAVARDRFVAGKDSDKAAAASKWLQQHAG